MATRGRIGIELKNGKILSSYHHWDGYPTGLGYNLVENWSDYNKLLEGIGHGDASVWNKEVGVKVDFDDRDAASRQNIYYGRDRGEQNVGPLTSDNFEAFRDEDGFNAGEEYAYVYTLDGLWIMVDKYNKLTDYDAEYFIRTEVEAMA